MLDALARNWWLLAIRGVAAILFGILAFIWPGLTLAVLVILFGAYIFVDGVFALIAAATGNTVGQRWWMLLLEGILGVLAGIVTFIYPSMTGVVLLYFIAGWAVATGVLEIMAAIKLRQEITNEWFLGLSGVLSILFGVLIAFWPLQGAIAIAWMLGAYAILFGTLMLILAFRLRGRKTDPNSLTPHVPTTA